MKLFIFPICIGVVVGFLILFSIIHCHKIELRADDLQQQVNLLQIDNEFYKSSIYILQHENDSLKGL
jgi:hypothetical protein